MPDLLADPRDGTLDLTHLVLSGLQVSDPLRVCIGAMSTIAMSCMLQLAEQDRWKATPSSRKL